jgi:hypothetical protein
LDNIQCIFISFPQNTKKKTRLKQEFPLFFFVRMVVSEEEGNDFLFLWRFQLSIQSSNNPVLTNDIPGMLAPNKLPHIFCYLVKQLEVKKLW